MLILASTSDKLQLSSSVATTLAVHVSWLDNNAGTITPGRTNTAISTATTADVVAAPASSVKRAVKELYVRNTGSTLPTSVTVQHTDGTTVAQLYKAALVADATLQYTDDGFVLFDPPEWWQAGSAADLHFAGERYFDGTDEGAAVTDFLSCTRASIGYAQTAAGTLVSFPANTLRITDLGLLVEEARTNLAVRSQEFDNAALFKENIGSVAANSIAAPDGTTTADLVIPNTTASTYHRIGQNFTAAAGSCTFSLYAKAGGYGWLGIEASSGIGANFDLINGVVGTVGSGMTASIEALANGWYRCLSIFTTAAAGETFYCCINSVDGGTDGVDFFTGNGTSGIYLWGGQIEQAAFASSYIPTTTASATRAADVAAMAGSLKTIVEADAAQSAVVDLKLSVANSTVHNLIADDGAVGNYRLGKNNDDGIWAWKSGGTLTTATLGSGLFSTGAKAGYSQDSSGQSIVGGGGIVVSNAEHFSAINPGLGHGGGVGINPFGYFRRLTVWNTRLADATLQGLTAP